MKRQQHHKKPIIKSLIGKFDVPEDVLFDIPRITLYDNTELRIENYKAILEYEENGIKLACKEKCILITGSKLDITIITDDEISVKGNIKCIEFA